MAILLKKSGELTDVKKYSFLTNYFVPASNFHFPAKRYGFQKRSFQHDWLCNFNGLVYTFAENLRSFDKFSDNTISSYNFR